jgi:hypothetical protein
VARARHRRRFAFVSSISFVALAAAAPVSAQVVNPTTAAFVASADHYATYSDGTPVVNHYEMDFYFSGASAPFQTASIGKPSPDGTGRIYISFASLFGTPLAAGPIYAADVAAIGVAGRGTSSISPYLFTFTSCTVGVSQLTANVPAAGGTVIEYVTTNPGCGWTATSSATWLGVTSGGSGSGSVTMTAAANVATNSRNATANIGGQTVTVTQEAACGYAASPSTVKMTASGSPASLTITAAAGCAWNATSNAAWLTVAGGAGSGSGSVTLSATPNNTGRARTTTVTVGGQTVSVTEAGKGKNR